MMRFLVILSVLGSICTSFGQVCSFETKHGIGIIAVSPAYYGSGRFEITLYESMGDSTGFETVVGEFDDSQFSQVQERFNHPPLKNKFGFAIQVITREGGMASNSFIEWR